MTALALTHWRAIVTGAALSVLGIMLILARSDARHWHKMSDGYQSQLVMLEASYRAAQATARANNDADVARAEQAGAQISKDHSDALEKQLADARALAADYARRLRSARTDQGHTGQGDVSEDPGAAQGADGTGGVPVMDESDLQICSVNTVKAQGWQDFYRDVRARYNAEGK